MSRFCDYPASIDFILPALIRNSYEVTYDNAIMLPAKALNPVGGRYNQRFARDSAEAYANVLTMLSMWQNSTIGRTYGSTEGVNTTTRLHASPDGNMLLSYADYTVDGKKWKNTGGRPLCSCTLSSFCGILGAIEILSGYNPLYRTNENIGTYEVQYTGGGLIQEQIYVGSLSTYYRKKINSGERYGLFMIPDVTDPLPLPAGFRWGQWINDAVGMNDFEYHIFDYPDMVVTDDPTKDYDDNVHNKIMIGGLLCKAVRYGTEMPGVSNTINSRCGGSTPGLGIDLARQFAQLFDCARFAYDTPYTLLAQVSETFGGFDLKPGGTSTNAHRPIWDYTITGHPFNSNVPLIDNTTGAPISYQNQQDIDNASTLPWVISRPVEQPEQCAEEFLDSFCNWYYDFSVQEKAQAKAAARYWYDRLGGETQCEYLKRTGARSPSKIIYW